MMSIFSAIFLNFLPSIHTESLENRLNINTHMEFKLIAYKHAYLYCVRVCVSLLNKRTVASTSHHIAQCIGVCVCAVHTSPRFILVSQICCRACGNMNVGRPQEPFNQQILSLSALLALSLCRSLLVLPLACHTQHATRAQTQAHFYSFLSQFTLHSTCRMVFGSQ